MNNTDVLNLKTDDRVRLTVEGTISARGALFIDAGPCCIGYGITKNALNADGASLVVLERAPVPQPAWADTWGETCRDKLGNTWRRSGIGWWRLTDFYGVTDYISYAELDAQSGPLTRLVPEVTA